MSRKDENKSSVFFRLFMSEQKVIYAYILSMVHNRVDADDVMQETATVMWEQFDDYQQGSNFGAWGTTIARYKILDCYLQKKRRKLNEKLVDKISDCAVSKLNEMPERISALQSCLKKLHERDRKLLEIRYEQNLKIADIALRVQRPVQGLYKAMARIHKTLHRCINHTMLLWGSR